MDTPPRSGGCPSSTPAAIASSVWTPAARCASSPVRPSMRGCHWTSQATWSRTASGSPAGSWPRHSSSSSGARGWIHGPLRCSARTRRRRGGSRGDGIAAFSSDTRPFADHWTNGELRDDAAREGIRVRYGGSRRRNKLTRCRSLGRSSGRPSTSRWGGRFPSTERLRRLHHPCSCDRDPSPRRSWRDALSVAEMGGCGRRRCAAVLRAEQPDPQAAVRGSGPVVTALAPAGYSRPRERGCPACDGASGSTRSVGGPTCRRPIRSRHDGSPAPAPSPPWERGPRARRPCSPP